MKPLNPAYSVFKLYSSRKDCIVWFNKTQKNPKTQTVLKHADEVYSPDFAQSFAHLI